MVALLDTSTLLWTLGEPERLSSTAKDAISNGPVWLSVASFWEVVIKTRKGALEIADPVSWWTRAEQILGADVLPIRASHVGALSRLPDFHRDPFDRILVAQSIVEGFTLITSDRNIAAYPVRVLW